MEGRLRPSPLPKSPSPKTPSGHRVHPRFRTDAPAPLLFPLLCLKVSPALTRATPSPSLTLAILPTARSILNGPTTAHKKSSVTISEREFGVREGGRTATCYNTCTMMITDRARSRILDITALVKKFYRNKGSSRATGNIADLLYSLARLDALLTPLQRLIASPKPFDNIAVATCACDDIRNSLAHEDPNRRRSGGSLHGHFGIPNVRT